MGVNWSVYTVGVLACLDGYMNIALEQTEEYVDGQVSIGFVTRPSATPFTRNRRNHGIPEGLKGGHSH